MNPVNQVLLSIPKALQDELITDSGLKLYLDPSYNKEFNVSVSATIAALPIKCDPKHKSILDQLKVGDEIAISYRVVADFHYQGDGDRFMPATEGSDYLQTFYNGKGEKIEIIALPGKISATWVGYYMGKRGNVIDGCQGSQSDVERWQSQFPFGKTDLYTFNNFFEYDGKEYWKCDIDDIYAKKENGRIVSVGDRVIGKPIDEKIPQEVLRHIQHTEGEVKVRYQDRFKVLTGGDSKDIKKGDIVGFNPQKLEKYTFWGKEFYLISEKLITGKWCKN